jgi:hypothetical protein
MAQTGMKKKKKLDYAWISLLLYQQPQQKISLEHDK